MKTKAVTGIVLTVLLIGMSTFAFVSNPIKAEPSPQQCPPGMISYWKFDEGSGTTAYDSADANDGTIYGATWTTGKVDDALSFDGDYVEVLDDASLNFGEDDFTIEAWIKTSASTGNIVSKRLDSGSYAQYDLLLEAGYLKFRTYENAETAVLSNTNVDDGEWHHVVGKREGSTVYVYIDGTIDNSGSGTIRDVNNGEVLRVGSLSPTGGGYFYGIIDEVAIYNRILTPEEIQQHYENGLMGLGYCEAEPVQAAMYETVEIFEDGSCQVYITMTAYSPSLVTIYERALGFNVSTIMYYDFIYTVPTSIPIESQMIFNEPDVTVIDPGTTNVVGTYPVNSSFCEGVYQQQLLSLGIRITSFEYVRMLKESATGYFLIYVKADAEFLQIEGSGKNRNVTIGPPTWEISCDHASFLLTKIAYIQEMLGNLTENIYHSLWTTQIILPATTTSSNLEELVGTDWGPVYFGSESAQIYAQISYADVRNVWLEEDMIVTENQVSKTESQLWQDLLCYKIFKIEYDPPYGGTCLTKEYASIIDDFSWGVHFTILKIENKKFTVQFDDPSGNVNVTMDGSFSVELSAHIGFKTKWFKLKKFYAYVELDGSLAANFTLEVKIDYEDSWSKDIYEWSGNKSKPLTFWIGTVPVWLIPHFTATAKFSIDIEGSVTVGCGAKVEGWMKAGVGWKKRFYPIFDAGMDVSVTDPTWDAEIRIEARPSLGFKPSIMFYDAAGPAVEIEPYLKVIYWDTGSGYELDYIAGVCLNIGISFSGWFKKITGLKDWFPATLFDWELWMHPPRPPHDIAVANIRSEEHAWVGETVTVSVDVVNLGNDDENDVDVTLYYSNGGAWQPIETKTGVSVPNRYCETLNFTWDTADRDGGDYTLNATATVGGDADSGNNNKTQPFRLEVQDIAVIDLVASGSCQEIVATVENAGTGNLSSVVVLLYYDGSLVGDGWCDYMRMAFNLFVGDRTELFFNWDMIAYPNPSEYVAEAIPLPYETITENNRLAGARFIGGVGGVWVPVDKLALLAPYIGLASTIVVATVATAIYVKRVKRRKKKQ